MNKYPSDAGRFDAPAPSVPPLSESPKPGGRRKVLTQIVLPLVVFVGLVAGITFVSQYVPGRRKEGVKNLSTGVGDPLAFREFHSYYWGNPQEKEKFPGDFEDQREKEGHYTFEFMNRQKEPAELGLKKKSCACAKVEVCLLSKEKADDLHKAQSLREKLLALAAFPGSEGAGGILQLIDEAILGKDGAGGFVGRDLRWQELTPNRTRDEGILVEPGTFGLIRLTWKDKRKETKNREEEERLVHTATMYMQMEGNVKSRKTFDLTAAVAFVPVLRVFPADVPIKEWSVSGIGTGEFRCWSSTRADFPLSVKESTGDSLFAIEAVPLTGSECMVLEKEIAEALLPASRVLSGYRVKVTVRQKMDNVHLEQGQIQRWLKLSSGRQQNLASVKVIAHVRGDVMVGKEDDRGKINMGNFRASAGKKMNVFLYPDARVEILPEKTEVKPKFLKVKVEKIGKRWLLNVAIPANFIGAWPNDSAILLHTKQEDLPPRRLRIPILANPYQ